MQKSSLKTECFLWRRRRDSNSRTPLRVTRFPIVRARPATRLLRVKTVFTFNSIELYHIAREKSSTISFFLENIKIPRRAGGVRRDALSIRGRRKVRRPRLFDADRSANTGFCIRRLRRTCDMAENGRGGHCRNDAPRYHGRMVRGRGERGTVRNSPAFAFGRANSVVLTT